MLLAQGKEGAEWIRRLPGPQELRQKNALSEGSGTAALVNRGGVGVGIAGKEGISARSGHQGDHHDSPPSVACGERPDGGGWWGKGDIISSASLFERECDKAARRIGRIFDPTFL